MDGKRTIPLFPRPYSPEKDPLPWPCDGGCGAWVDAMIDVRCDECKRRATERK